MRFRRRQAGQEGAVHEQAPDLLEGNHADEVLDVHTAVAERAALLVGLRDLGREGDHAFEPGSDLAQIRGDRGGSAHALKIRMSAVVCRRSPRTVPPPGAEVDSRTGAAAPPRAASRMSRKTVLFYRHFKRFAGHHLKVWDY